jgi:hypothetical protein
MSFPTLMNISLLAQTEAVGERTTRLAWDLPESGWKWGLYIGLMAVAIVMVLVIYIKDTFLLHGFWKFWLTVLRLSVVAGLFVILFNPHLRSQTNSVRPSRVAVLIDDSSSMSFEEKEPSAETAATKRSRTAAVIDLLSNTPLIDELRKKHEVTVYKFGSKLEGPLHIFPSKDARATAPDDTGADSPKPTDTGGPVNWKDLLTSGGTETRMGQAVLELTGKVSGETLSGLVVIGDGGSNAGVDVKAANSVAQTARPRIRLISVGVGSSKQQVNLRVANIQGPTDVHLGDAYELSAFVQAEGMKEGESLQLDVDLLARPVADKDAEPTLIEQREVTILENGVPVELKFQQNPTVSGSVEFIVRASPQKKIRELREQDNRATHEVNIIERNTSVLIVAGGPMRDYRFVRNMLDRHPAIDVDVWLQSVDADRIGQVSQDSDDLLIEFPLNFPTRPLAAEIPSESKKPKRYDVVMAFDPDWSLIPAEQLTQLHDWVDELAGGLVLVAGDVYTPELAGADDSLQSVRDMYPVFLTSYLLDFADDRDSDQPWKIDFTREGNNIDFLRLTENPVTADEVWKEFEGVYRCYPTDGPKAGTTIYAHFSDPRAINENGAPILLASQFYGAGRSFYVGSPEVWRLRSLSDKYYDRFWTKLVREAGMGRLKRGNSRALLMPERVEYGIGDTVKIRVRLLNQQFQPLVQPSVDLEVVAPNGRRFIPPVKLVADGTDKREGQYIGDFRASLEGKYTLGIPVPDSKQIESKTVNVTVPDLESQNPQQHADLLETLARDTGGKYLTLETAVAELPALLPDRSKLFVIEDRPDPLWDKNWVLYLLVGLLSVEWLTRKLLKLA